MILAVYHPDRKACFGWKGERDVLSERNSDKKVWIVGQGDWKCCDILTGFDEKGFSPYCGREVKRKRRYQVDLI